MRSTGFTGDFAAFLKFLRTDPRFYPKTAEQLLKEASWIAKRMDGKLPSLFGRLPRQPYTVEPVPEYLAPKYTAGRYNGNPPDGTEPGYYWVNTYALETRPLYNLEALTLHEAVPGHHLQIALANEAGDVPKFRRYSYISAFGEGWGLYSEWLGLEAGFYTDPYSNFGRLTYEMWRAAGWSSTPACTPRAGRASRRSTTWRRTPRCRCTSARPRPTATSPGPARRWPTRSASSRSASCAPAPRQALGRAFDVAASTTRSSATARCRCRCSSSRSTRSSRASRRADARLPAGRRNRPSARANGLRPDARPAPTPTARGT